MLMFITKLLTFHSPRHADIIVGTELIKLLGYWCKTIGIDLELELAISIQRYI